MKRMYFGIGLLAALLALSFLSGAYLARQSNTICACLEQAQTYAFSGDYAQAGQSVDQAYRHWQHHQNRFASLTDHAPMEAIDDLFQSAGEYARLGEGEEFTLLCGRISRMVEMVSQAQKLCWWNLL